MDKSKINRRELLGKTGALFTLECCIFELRLPTLKEASQEKI